MVHDAYRFIVLCAAAAIAASLTPATTARADEFGIRNVTAGPVSPDHYVLRLDDTHNGSIWPIDMHIEYRDGRFGRTWIVGLWRLMGSDEPRLELDPVRLTIDEKGVRGTARVNLIDKPRHAKSTMEFVLNLTRQESLLEGTWERRFGEAGEQKTVGGDIEGDANTPGRIALKLNGIMHGFSAGGDYLWLMLSHEDGRITEAWGEAKRIFNPLKHTVDYSALKFDGETLRGEAAITLLPDGYVPEDQQPVHCLISLDVKTVDGRMVGDYKGEWNSPLTWSGKATGEVQTEFEWLGRNRISTGGRDWPKWLGPFDNGAGQSSGQELVASLSDARLVWKSEPTPRSHGEPPSPSHGFPDGGASSPVVKDGRVYLFYELPHGGEYDKSQESRARAEGITDYDTKQWSILADEVLLCVDAETGRTLWKTVFPGKGLYWLPGKHGVTNLTPCVFNGRVYAIGTTGRVYCADAKTGRKLWESDLGAKHDALKAYAARCLIDRRFGSHPGMHRVSTPTFSESDDVLITTDFQIARDVWRANHGVIGFDGRTGRVRWRMDGVLGLWASPLSWSYDGKEYVIAGNVKGELRCIDPESGTVVWEVGGCGQFWSGPSIVGDYLLAPVGGLRWKGSEWVNGGYAQDSDCRLACYRLSARGAERIWMLSSRYNYPGFDNLCGRGGYIYARLDRRQVCIELETGEIVASEDRDPLFQSPTYLYADRSGCGVNELWENRWAYAPNFTQDAADGTNDQIDARRFHMFKADPKGFELLDETLLPHKRFSTGACRGLAWPYVDGRLFVRGGDGIYCYDLRDEVE